VSAPEARADALRGVGVGRCELDIVELAALRGRVPELASIAAGRGLPLPALGQVRVQARGAVLAVRPDRWLLLLARREPGAHHAEWAGACAGVAAAVDLSGALAAFLLDGDSVPEVLARGCRLDLPGFAGGQAAATVIAQVLATLARLPGEWLLLTPATTAQHFSEWLMASAAPFGAEPRTTRSLSSLVGAHRS
jgi:heterotetrameric sarcosine oxidase gamma subunit